MSDLSEPNWRKMMDVSDGIIAALTTERDQLQQENRGYRDQIAMLHRVCLEKSVLTVQRDQLREALQKQCGHFTRICDSDGWHCPTCGAAEGSHKSALTLPEGSGDRATRGEFEDHLIEREDNPYALGWNQAIRTIAAEQRAEREALREFVMGLVDHSGVDHSERIAGRNEVCAEIIAELSPPTTPRSEGGDS